MGKRSSSRHSDKPTFTSKGRAKTRSDKPKLIEDPDQEEKVLTQQLRENGLYAANILGDGNCLFRALSDQLYGSPAQHLSLRSQICDHLKAQPDHYRVFIDEDDYKGGWDGYVREMRQPGTYGTNIELSAFVHLYRRPIKIFQPGLVYVMQVENPPSSTDSSTSSAVPSTSTNPMTGTQVEGKMSARERRAKAREEKTKNAEKSGKKGKGKENLKPSSGDSLKSGSANGKEEEELGPLCIVYHSWEHYSSLRNLKGPHTGPPRLQIARPKSPSLVEHPSASARSTSPTATHHTVPQDEGDYDPNTPPVVEEGDEDVEMDEVTPRTESKPLPSPTDTITGKKKKVRDLKVSATDRPPPLLDRTNPSSSSLETRPSAGDLFSLPTVQKFDEPSTVSAKPLEHDRTRMIRTNSTDSCTSSSSSSTAFDLASLPPLPLHSTLPSSRLSTSSSATKRSRSIRDVQDPDPTTRNDDSDYRGQSPTLTISSTGTSSTSSRTSSTSSTTSSASSLTSTNDKKPHGLITKTYKSKRRAQEQQEQQLEGDRDDNEDEDEEDEIVLVRPTKRPSPNPPSPLVSTATTASSTASSSPAPSSSPEKPSATSSSLRKRVPRGPTGREKKEIARNRRMERRRRVKVDGDHENDDDDGGKTSAKRVTRSSLSNDKDDGMKTRRQVAEEKSLRGKVKELYI